MRQYHWSNFCDPHWELICRSKWYPGKISTPPEITARTYFNAWHGFKTTLVFLPADVEACWFLLPSAVFLQSNSTVQPENIYSWILKVTNWVWENPKMISTNTNHNYRQRSSPWVSLSWSNNKIRLNFKQPYGKRWGARLVGAIKRLLHKVYFLTPSPEGWPTNAKEAPSPHEVRLTLLDANSVANSVFHCLGKFPINFFIGTSK